MSLAITPRYGITPRQRDCYNAIVAHIQTHGCAPSYEELMKALGLASKGAVNRMMCELQDRGWVAFKPGRSRSVTILPVSSGEIFILPPSLQSALRAHCERTKENPAAVLADAVALHLDAAEQDCAA